MNPRAGWKLRYPPLLPRDLGRISVYRSAGKRGRSVTKGRNPVAAEEISPDPRRNGRGIPGEALAYQVRFPTGPSRPSPHHCRSHGPARDHVRKRSIPTIRHACDRKAEDHREGACYSRDERSALDPTSSEAVVSSVRTSQGMMTCRKMTGSGHTFTCLPRWPPWGLTQAVLGTSPRPSRR